MAHGHKASQFCCSTAIARKAENLLVSYLQIAFGVEAHGG
jgi:hypothetical protein